MEEQCLSLDMSSGVCTKLKECTFFKNEDIKRAVLTLERTAYVGCSSVTLSDKICCPAMKKDTITYQDIVNEEKAESSKATVENEDATELFKDLISTQYYPIYPPYCGFSDAPHDRIVGGEPSEKGNFTRC